MSKSKEIAEVRTKLGPCPFCGSDEWSGLTYNFIICHPIKEGDKEEAGVYVEIVCDQCDSRIKGPIAFSLDEKKLPIMGFSLDDGNIMVSEHFLDREREKVVALWNQGVKK